MVMEATGDYWKPFYYLLEDADFEVMLVNARQVKNLPGRKSDVSDAAWLNSARTVSSEARSSHRRPSENSVTSPERAP